MDNLQDMPKAVAVYLAGIQRLRAFEQHVELLVGFMQMPSLFRDRGFERTVERSQLGGHVVEGAGELAQLVRQGGIGRRGCKFPSLNPFAGRHQIVKRQHHLATDASQGK